MFDFDVREGYPVAEPEMLVHLSRIRALREELAAPLSRVPRRPPLMLAPDTTAREAVRLLIERRVGSALIVSHGLLLGTLSERDVLRRLADEAPDTLEMPLWKLMATEPETLLENDTVAYAIRKLRTLGVRALPVLRTDGHLHGLLETHDILGWLGDRMTAGVLPTLGNV